MKEPTPSPKMTASSNAITATLSTIHRLQRERGATAGFVASGGEYNPVARHPCNCGTGSLVADVRRRTDRIASEAVMSEVGPLRSSVDSAVNDVSCGCEAGKAAKVFFSIFQGYSSIISGLTAQAATELTGGGDCADAEEANKEGELVVAVAAAAGHRC